MKFLKKVKEYKDVKDYVLTYLTMRRIIGIFGFALPIALIIGSFLPFSGSLEKILPSISDYYDTYMRNILVGVLCGVSLFLFSYRGFSFIDNLAANCAAFFALGAAFFPTNSSCAFVHYYHMISAALFFCTLACISLFLFTLTEDGSPAKGRKIIRNRIYRICGIFMLVSTFLMLLYIVFLENKIAWLDKLKPIFIMETLSLFAFGTSWLIKGRTLWADKQ